MCPFWGTHSADGEGRIGMESLRQAEAKVVGTKQVLRGLKAGSLLKVYVANDADTYLFQRITTAAQAAGVPVVRVASMKELGALCGVEVGSAAAGVAKD